MPSRYSNFPRSIDPSVTTLLHTPNMTRSYTFLVDDTLERHVQTQAFDEECAVYSREISKGSLSDDTDSDTSLFQRFLRRVLSLRGLQARGASLLFRSPGSQTPWSQVDLQDLKGCLPSAHGARARPSSHAAPPSLRARQAWEGQSVGDYSF
jgi:hypothetical protein